MPLTDLVRKTPGPLEPSLAHFPEFEGVALVWLFPALHP